MCHSSPEAGLESRFAACPHPRGQVTLKDNIDNSKDNVSSKVVTWAGSTVFSEGLFCRLGVPCHSTSFLLSPSGLLVSSQDQCLADGMV